MPNQDPVPACAISHYPLSIDSTAEPDDVPIEQREFDAALARFLVSDNAGQAVRVGEELIALRKKLHVNRFRSTPVRQLKPIVAALRDADDGRVATVLGHYQSLLQAQAGIMQHRGLSPAETRESTKTVFDARNALRRICHGRVTAGLMRARSDSALALLNGVDRVYEAIGSASCSKAVELRRRIDSDQPRRLTLRTLAWLLERLPEQGLLQGLLRDTRAGTWAASRATSLRGKLDSRPGFWGLRARAWVLENFLSYDALRHSGVETSWGFRITPPGDPLGLAFNTGPWVMFYSGSLHNYQSGAVPYRINPGATVAFPNYVFTINRPGLGSGPATPAASAYVDSSRYKLMVGRDGWIYVRVGDWESRGPYFTFSANIPLNTNLKISYNFSLFSPGFGPMANALYPYAKRVQAWNIRANHRLGAPFRWVWRVMKGGADSLLGR